MTDEEQRKIDEELKKEIHEAKKDHVDQMDVSERAEMLEGKIPTEPKKKDDD